MNQLFTISVDLSATDKRLDVYLTEQLPDFSRSHIQAMIRNGDISIDGKRVKTGYKLQAGEYIQVEIVEAEPIAAKPEAISLDILYEDDDIVVVNKAQGMVVHPAAGHADGTLVNALLHHCENLSGINGTIRPGIVHRIDKDTSGILVVAKNDRAHTGLIEQWKVHDIKRIYHAIVHGLIVENAGIVDAPIGRHPRDRKKMAVEPRNGRNAVTHYQVLERLPFALCTYAQMELETGRTHQIRVHMAHLGHPVVGDSVYGYRKEKYNLNGQMLHAKVLGFRHPLSGKYMEFESDLPDYFSQLLQQMRQVKQK